MPSEYYDVAAAAHHRLSVCSVRLLSHSPSVHSRTSTDPAENPYYGAFASVLQQLGRKVELQIFPAGTDGRYLREVGVPVLGFSPIRLQPVLLHDHDERLSVECYLEGVKVYEKLIPALANMLQ